MVEAIYQVLSSRNKFISSNTSTYSDKKDIHQSSEIQPQYYKLKAP